MTIPRNTTFNGSFLRPSDEIDPNKKSKDPKYALAFSKFIYSNFMNDNSAIKSAMADRFVRNRKYAVGQQDTDQYKNWIFGDEKPGPTIPVEQNGVDNLINDLKMDDLGLDNINWDDVFSPLPKYVENIVGIMRSQHHDIQVNAVDENSGTEREEMKYGALISEQLKAVVARFDQVFGIPNTQEQAVKPKSIEELELFDNIGAFKLPVEIAMEDTLVHTFDISDFDKGLKDDTIANFIIDGYSAVVTLQDVASGKFIPQGVDVLDIVLEDSKKENFSDSTWGGFIEYYTIEKLRAETGWKEEKLSKMANRFKGEHGNPRVFDDSKENGQYNYDDYRIPVMCNFWKALDKEHYSQRDTKLGPVQVYEPWKKNGSVAPKERPNRKLEKVNIRRLYKAKWVIGSEDVFDYGPVANTAYNFGTNDVEFPIKLFKIKGKPKIESMIPIEDQIYLTFIKTQNAIASAAPPGIAVEWGSVQNISFGKKKLSPKDSIRLYRGSGNFIYQLEVSTMPGNLGSNRVGKPVEELKGGLGTAIADGISGIEFLYRQLDVISGIDGITSVSQAPNRDTGKAVTEMAVAATSNTLKPIYNGFLTLKESAARATTWQVQALVGSYTPEDLEECPYFRALGRANLLAIMSAGGFPPTVYGLAIVARASETEKQRMLAAAEAGLQSGKNGIPAITASEYSFITRFLASGRSIKWLEIWMAKKEQERAAQDQKMAQENIEKQAEEQRKTDENKARLEKEKFEYEVDKELAKIVAKGEQDRLTLAEKGRIEKELLQDELRLKELSINNVSEN